MRNSERGREREKGESCTIIFSFFPSFFLLYPYFQNEKIEEEEEEEEEAGRLFASTWSSSLVGCAVSARDHGSVFRLIWMYILGPCVAIDVPI